MKSNLEIDEVTHIIKIIAPLFFKINSKIIGASMTSLEFELGQTYSTVRNLTD